MEFSQQDWSPPAGAFRLVFRVEGRLDRAAVEPLLRALVGNSPVPPAEAELDPSGEGWFRFDADEDVTITDREQILAWLEGRPGLVSVRCVAE